MLSVLACSLVCGLSCGSVHDDSHHIRGVNALWQAIRKKAANCQKLYIVKERDLRQQMGEGPHIPVYGSLPGRKTNRPAPAPSNPHCASMEAGGSENAGSSVPRLSGYSVKKLPFQSPSTSGNGSAAHRSGAAIHT